MVVAVASQLVNPLSVVLPTLACFFSNLNVKDGVERSYDGYQVLRVNATTSFAYNIIQRLYEGDNFDFWNPPSRIRPIDINVCPDQVSNIKVLLSTLQVPYEVLIGNLSRKINEEKHKALGRHDKLMNWETYHRLGTIHKWLDTMASTYPQFVSVLTIGNSTEGRPLKVLSITTDPNVNKPKIWLDGGIHAREWISPAVVTYMANELIQIASKNPKHELINTFHWYILSNVNPDGYEFSHTKDRMWRKTRSNGPGFFGTVFKCKGADPNRNFEYKWGGRGTSNNPCSDIYRGPKPASEPEIAAIQNFLRSQQDFKLFLTFHSYAQMLFLPWGYDRIRVPDHEELLVVANKAADALKHVYGTKYTVGPSPELLYAAAGGSEDFAKGIANIKYSYCFELRDTGDNGFILPPHQIIPSGIETFAAVSSMANDMIKIYNLN